MELYACSRDNVRRRAVIRIVLAVVLLFLALSTMFGLLGSALTVTVPEGVTAVTLQRLEGTTQSIPLWERTLTQPEDIAVFTDYFSGVGKLREAHRGDGWYSSAPCFSVTMHTDGGVVADYFISPFDTLQQSGSKEYEFYGYDEVMALFSRFKPQ